MARRTSIEPSDDDLLIRARAGDDAAFDRLWERHRASASRVAQQFSAPSGSTGLEARARTVIADRVRAGGGPAGAFRPYLYSTIRLLADGCDAPTTDAAADADGDSMERDLTVRAYRSLPQRWQTVLWYAEVERMSAADIGTVVGMRSDQVTESLHRAREALRTAWIQAHATDASTAVECRWALARIPDADGGGLAALERTRFDTHLSGCARCTTVRKDSHRVPAKLAWAVVPATVGPVAAGAVLSQLGVGAVLAAQGATAAVGTAATVGAATGTVGGVSTVAVGLAAAAAITGSLAFGAGAATAPQPTTAPSSPTAISAPLASSTTGTPIISRPQPVAPVSIPAPVPATSTGPAPTDSDTGSGSDSGSSDSSADDDAPASTPSARRGHHRKSGSGKGKGKSAKSGEHTGSGTTSGSSDTTSDDGSDTPDTDPDTPAPDPSPADASAPDPSDDPGADGGSTGDSGSSSDGSGSDSGSDGSGSGDGSD